VYKWDKPENRNFAGEARRWLHFTHDKCFESWKISLSTILVISEDELPSLDVMHRKKRND